MRKFYIEAENGLRYDLQSDKCFLNNPTGLGFYKNTSYAMVGEYFIVDNIKSGQKTISGQLMFIGDYYENYKEFISFIKSYKNYKLVYIPKDKEYFIDVDITSVGKGDTQGKRFLTCDLSLSSKSLFYTQTVNTYNLVQSSVGSRWDARFDFQFTDNIPGELLIQNNGHIASAFEFSINGVVENPYLEVYEDGVLVNKLEFNITVGAGETLLFGNKDNDLYVLLDDGLGNVTNKFDTLDITNENFFKLRVGTSLLSFNGTTPISELSVTTYQEYEAV